MNTPIYDFVTKYIESNTERMHMPGHKGVAFLGVEDRDITEINGADSLYKPTGIIKESEENATNLFGSKRTLYSTEGSSQCIKVMIYLALMDWKRNNPTLEKPVIIAARNAHVSFVHAAGLCDVDVLWLWPEKLEERKNICSCKFSMDKLDALLKENGKRVIGVYITSPDYLGYVADLENIEKLVHSYNTKLLVDNAHGAYLKFLDYNKYSKYKHPLDFGVDMVCDSAHKTLPVLTGGAYLHLQKGISDYILDNAKRAMLIFGSTSPSYLILQSLDLCNAYISNRYIERLEETCNKISDLKATINKKWEVCESDPLRITVRIGDGKILEKLKEYGIEYEYANDFFVVFMITPENSLNSLEKLETVFGEVECGIEESEIKNKITDNAIESANINSNRKIVDINEALFNPNLPDVCTDYELSCPPAILKIVPGEKND